MDIHLQTQDRIKIEQWLHGISDDIRARVDNSILKLVDTGGTTGKGVIDYLKATTPRSKIGDPHMADKWVRDIDRDARGFIATITIKNVHPNAEKILPYLEFGTKAHTITGNPLLHFFIDDGTEIWTHLVHHPGTKPYRMIENARVVLERGIADIQSQIYDEFDAVMKGESIPRRGSRADKQSGGSWGGTK